MNSFFTILNDIKTVIARTLALPEINASRIELTFQTGKNDAFGDLSCNAAMTHAKTKATNPRVLAQEIITALATHCSEHVAKAELAGPGFINITLTNQAWAGALELGYTHSFFSNQRTEKRKKYLIEFVSANPTGPLHLGHGRGGIIGDVLSHVLTYNKNTVHKEFYINDAGNQIAKLGTCFKIRVQQELGIDAVLPEDGYQGLYLVDLAKICVAEHGKNLLEKDETFFADYAKKYLLIKIEETLKSYGITFDEFYSEKSLHDSGLVTQALDILTKKGLAYEQDGATWFKSTEFGDDKDRVVRKSTGELSYIASDIAYHKNKLERGYDVLIDILGQDHHGYIKRLKAVLTSFGFNDSALDIIIYQLVTMKQNDVVVRMSKRSGKFETLEDIIATVGKDVARFFYLHRKAEAHLEFDLETALKKTDENPVYYIQYAYVRTHALLEKASLNDSLNDEVQKVRTYLNNNGSATAASRAHELAIHLSDSEKSLIKKICSLEEIITSIEKSYQTHLLSYYTLELAQQFHGYYATHQIIDVQNPEISKRRLFIVGLVRSTLGLCLDLLGLDKPEKM